MGKHAIKRPEIIPVSQGEPYSRVCDGGGGRCSNKLAEADCVVIDGHLFTVQEYLAPIFELGYGLEDLVVKPVLASESK